MLGSDRPAWAPGYGRIAGQPEAVIVALSEHHATVSWPADEPVPALGSLLDVIPNHVCLVLNLVDEVVAVTASGSERWPVAARGKNG
ncbi:hypothetical protein GCM10017586_25430 [Microbacterium imperiale]|uniref:D-serine dehydratase-like domain-containing protein n=1 Tax=Microbacterium imperiale TaxID=33884 RepID=A0A9W6HIR9_9MICO|nr:hypothetical protein GCM10017544_28640 [Microbacterium imperiale]GLJ80860.1 hypothetical protein GCM10017586_25430 [Microbacterium imperiale]